MNEAPRAARREVVYRGHVQGVGFRFTVRSLAFQFRVTGYVANLPDGGVRLIVEGESGETDRFLAAISAEMGDFIRETTVEESPAQGEFQGFEIRR